MISLKKYKLVVLKGIRDSSESKDKAKEEDDSNPPEQRRMKRPV